MEVVKKIRKFFVLMNHKSNCRNSKIKSSNNCYIEYCLSDEECIPIRSCPSIVDLLTKAKEAPINSLSRTNIIIQVREKVCGARRDRLICCPQDGLGLEETEEYGEGGRENRKGGREEKKRLKAVRTGDFSVVAHLDFLRESGGEHKGLSLASSGHGVLEEGIKGDESNNPCFRDCIAGNCKRKGPQNNERK